MELTQRQKMIFKTIVEQFTATAEPIGSKTLMQLLDVHLSSATIRNEMAVLEKEGLLEKMHTSSGRIPSRKGYRYYVANLMEASLDPTVETSLQAIFSKRHFSLDEIVEISCSVLSEMTNLTSVALGPDHMEERLAHVSLIPVSDKQAVAIIVTSSGHTENRMFEFDETVSLKDLKTCTDLFNDQLCGVEISQVIDKMKEIEPLMAAKMARHEVLFDAFVSAFMRFASEQSVVRGRANMLCQPEFSDVRRLEELMRVLENSSLFKAWTDQADNIAVPIGTRNELIQIGDCSVVSTKFRITGGEQGQLMIVGPNRMPYARVIAMMDYISDVIEGTFETHEGGSEDGQES